MIPSTENVDDSPGTAGVGAGSYYHCFGDHSLNHSHARSSSNSGIARRAPRSSARTQPSRDQLVPHTPATSYPQTMSHLNGAKHAIERPSTVLISTPIRCFLAST